MTVDPATVIEFYREKMRQTYIEIIEPASGNRVVTAIEVLSPDNKSAGSGASSYLRKQQELWDSGANLVEIDLLSSGTRSTRVEREKAAHVLSQRYLVTVTREFPTRSEFYGIDLPQPLPKVAIPLNGPHEDIPLNLQTVFTKCYDSGPYPQLLYYEQSPPTPLTPAERDFVKQALAARS